MSKYLMIRSPGVADHRSLTWIGVGTDSNENRIGQFHSGCKYSIALLMRKHVGLKVFCGLTKMEFKTENIFISDKNIQQIQYDLSGQVDGKPTKRLEKLSYSTDMGYVDWTNVGMAIREFVSNARDACIDQNLPISEIEIAVVDENECRAKKSHTAIFIEFTDEVEYVYQNDFPHMFLNYSVKDLQDKVILRKPQPNPIRVYKKGVLACEREVLSIFNYNINDLRLDETRNADFYATKDSISWLLPQEMTAADIEYFFQQTSKNKNLLEAKLNLYVDTDNKVNVAKLKEKFSKVIGDHVVCSNEIFFQYLIAKGKVPFVVANSQWVEFFSKIGMQTETNCLTNSEKKGRIIKSPVGMQTEVVKKIWDKFSSLGIIKNKEMPEVKAFFESTEGGGKTLGYYENNTVYLLESLDSGMELVKTAIEEMIHYLSGAGDFSRDYQEFANDIIARLL